MCLRPEFCVVLAVVFEFCDSECVCSSLSFSFLLLLSDDLVLVSLGLGLTDGFASAWDDTRDC